MQQIAVMSEETGRGRRTAIGVPGSADIHRPHSLLRTLPAATVSSPTRSDNSPGYDAAYFTHDTRGMRVEYVHRCNDGGES